MLNIGTRMLKIVQTIGLFVVGIIYKRINNSISFGKYK